MREKIDNISHEGLNAIQIISDLTMKINDIEKETVIRSTYAFAMSDDKLDDSEYTFLFEVGKDLEMTNSHIQGVIANHEVYS